MMKADQQTHAHYHKHRALSLSELQCAPDMILYNSHFITHQNTITYAQASHTQTQAMQ